MRFDPEKYHRHSIRLRDYDYSQAGAYFVTVCVQGRLLVFGSIENARMELNKSGVTAVSVWQGLSERFPSVELDDFVLMPNHLHGLVVLAPTAMSQGSATKLGEIVRVFKAVTTRLLRLNDITNFSWQRNYYEHVVRDERDLLRIRQYIANNPASWEDDAENPSQNNM